MATVAEVKEIFAKKGLRVKFPVQDDFLVKNIDIVERHTYPGGGIHFLLRIAFIDNKGREVSELFPCDGRIERKKPLITVSEEIPKPLTMAPLPMRGKVAFENAQEALEYIGKAITHLITDRGYQGIQQGECDLYFEKGSRGFFINLAPRCDDAGLGRTKELIRLRGKHGSGHDYALVVPAFQDSLGVTLLFQENWFREHGEPLAGHRIGVYGVNNSDPNLIFPFTIYPRERDLARYFMYTGPQWSILRNKYVSTRKRGTTERDGNSV